MGDKKFPKISIPFLNIKEVKEINFDEVIHKDKYKGIKKSK